ncbi:MAG: arginine--tRNA ligase [Caulobacterales bacterium]|nr:arginine--tRNA ligase [Caulobacterales bacterium]
MPSLLEALSARVGAAFEARGLEGALGRVVRSSRPELAPFQCNGAMAAAKRAKANPRDIAGDVLAELSGEPLIAEAEIAGPGFINLTPADGAVSERAAALADDPRAGAGRVAAPRRVVIDFGGPNVAKPMHVGHLRSAVIGDCLQRLFRFRGDEVVSDVHLGDWGLQMGHLITELEEEQPELVYFQADAEGPFPDTPPVTLEDLARLYPAGSAKAKADPERLARARRATAELQAGRAGYRALLDHFIEVSKAGLKSDYADLDVAFDLWKGESDVDPLVPELVEDFKTRGVAREDAGAWIVPVARESDKKEAPPLILVSSEGSALYATTDLATILDRVRALAPDLMLYVVDQRQAQHFEQVFRAADAAGLIDESALEHIGFGTVNGTDGKPFKTREGGVLRLADLLASAQDSARARIGEAGLAADLDGEEGEAVARLVANAAIKFADLQNHRMTNYVFDLDRFMSFEGKTGPYLLYAAVRVKSLLRRASEAGGAPGPIAVAAPEERALVYELDAFDAALAGAYDKRAPNIVCDHAYGLAGAFSKFYASCPVLAAPDAATRDSRLALAALTLKQLELALDLLGIATPDRM